MGAPTSSVLSEVYLPCMENTTIYDLLIKHQVERYLRYVDDILILYRDDKTNTRDARGLQQPGPHYEIHSKKGTKQ
jgi:hypothetical protein